MTHKVKNLRSCGRLTDPTKPQTKIPGQNWPGLFFLSNSYPPMIDNTQKLPLHPLSEPTYSDYALSMLFTNSFAILALSMRMMLSWALP
jgi:hypothetical protein